MTQGQSLPTAVRNARVWGKRQAALERAARRAAPDQVDRLLHALAQLDAVAKGLGRRDPWDLLVALALDLCGRAALPGVLQPVG